DAAAMAVQYGTKDKLCGPMLAAVKANVSLTHAFANYTLVKYGHAFGFGCFYDTGCLKSNVDRWPEGRSWRWQKCSQLAYFQVAPHAGSLRSSIVNLDYHEQQCFDIFGDAVDPSAGVADNIQRYGGDKPKGHNIFYANAGDDPWQRASVTSTLSLDQPFYLAKCDLCGHCGDLGDGSVDPAPRKYQKELIREYIAKWVAPWTAKAAADAKVNAAAVAVVHNNAPVVGESLNQASNVSFLVLLPILCLFLAFKAIMHVDLVRDAAATVRTTPNSTRHVKVTFAFSTKMDEAWADAAWKGLELQGWEEMELSATKYCYISPDIDSVDAFQKNATAFGTKGEAVAFALHNTTSFEHIQPFLWDHMRMTLGWKLLHRQGKSPWYVMPNLDLDELLPRVNLFESTIDAVEAYLAPIVTNVKRKQVVSPREDSPVKRHKTSPATGSVDGSPSVERISNEDMPTKSELVVHAVGTVTSQEALVVESVKAHTASTAPVKVDSVAGEVIPSSTEVVDTTEAAAPSSPSLRITRSISVRLSLDEVHIKSPATPRSKSSPSKAKSPKRPSTPRKLPSDAAASTPTRTSPRNVKASTPTTTPSKRKSPQTKLKMEQASPSKSPRAASVHAKASPRTSKASSRAAASPSVDHVSAKAPRKTSTPPSKTPATKSSKPKTPTKAKSPSKFKQDSCDTVITSTSALYLKNLSTKLSSAVVKKHHPEPATRGGYPNQSPKMEALASPAKRSTRSPPSTPHVKPTPEEASTTPTKQNSSKVAADNDRKQTCVAEGVPTSKPSRPAAVPTPTQIKPIHKSASPVVPGSALQTGLPAMIKYEQSQSPPLGISPPKTKNQLQLDSINDKLNGSPMTSSSLMDILNLVGTPPPPTAATTTTTQLSTSHGCNWSLESPGKRPWHAITGGSSSTSPKKRRTNAALISTIMNANSPVEAKSDESMASFIQDIVCDDVPSPEQTQSTPSRPGVACRDVGMDDILNTAMGRLTSNASSPSSSYVTPQVVEKTQSRLLSPAKDVSFRTKVLQQFNHGGWRSVAPKLSEKGGSYTYSHDKLDARFTRDDLLKYANTHDIFGNPALMDPRMVYRAVRGSPQRTIPPEAVTPRPSSDWSAIIV
ncbi:hypothetical protein DYB28_002573, partial [Aphanomyces astaci]